MRKALKYKKQKALLQCLPWKNIYIYIYIYINNFTKVAVFQISIIDGRYIFFIEKRFKELLFKPINVLQHHFILSIIVISKGKKVAFSEIKNTNFNYSLHDKLAPSVMKLYLEIIKNKFCLFFEYSVIVCEGGRCYLTLKRPLCR